MSFDDFTFEELDAQRTFQRIVDAERHAYFHDPNCWVTADGRKIPYEQLNDYHIINILHKWHRNEFDDEFRESVEKVHAEAVKRNLITEQSE